jgi:hypothetical protein
LICGDTSARVHTACGSGHGRRSKSGPHLLHTQHFEDGLVVPALHVVAHDALVVFDELAVEQQLLHAPVAGDEVERRRAVQRVLSTEKSVPQA